MNVVVGAHDLNPKTKESIAYLQKHHITVETGCEEEIATALNPIFNHAIQYEKIFVQAKWAMSLDGRMIKHPNQNRHISHEKSQQHAHYWRQYCDGIIVGVGTILADNPRLTSRYTIDPTISAAHPLRIILDPQGKTPLDAHVLANTTQGKTYMACGDTIDPTWKKNIEDLGHQVHLFKLNSQQHIPLDALLGHLYQIGLTSVLVEGGARVRDSFLNANLINAFDIYLAPCIIGSDPQKPMQTWQMASQKTIESDIHFNFKTQE